MPSALTTEAPQPRAPAPAGRERRLLMVTTVPVTLECFLLPLAEHMRLAGWRVDAMANGVAASAACRGAFDRVWDVELSRNPLDPRNLFQAASRLKHVVRAEAYDVVHAHTPVAGFVARYALRDLKEELGCKVVYTAHGFHFHSEGSPFRNRLFLSLEQWAAPWTDHLVVINDEDRRAAAKYSLIDADSLSFMHGVGVEVDRYSPEAVGELEAEGVRRELGLRDEDVLFCLVADFMPEKRQALVLEALAALGDERVHLALAGDGPTKSGNMHRAVELGIGGRAHFLGLRSDVPALLAASRASILFSSREGLSRAVMESLAMSRPVVGADVRGIRDLVEGGRGILVAPGSVRGLTEAIRWMTEHPGEAAEMGRLGREAMVEGYDAKDIIAEHESLYERLADA